MKDRRFYERVKVNIPCMIYALYGEYEGHIVDISEDGLCIEMKEAIECQRGQRLGIACIGSYKNCNIEKITIMISEYIKVARVTKNRRKIGCQIMLNKGQLVELAEGKKVESYCKQLGKNKR